jgi:hypothetical protein
MNRADEDVVQEIVADMLADERRRIGGWIYHVAETHPGLDVGTRDALRWLAGKIDDGDEEVPNPNAPAPRDA